ncbi:Tryptophanase [Hexamita inflata]|uniref:Tryptophanase n=1 Tax=Hexamita inflata TaxID=28002 RepID=A0AA86QGL3_9EUKA|nr:Tryptophanase [Hexamita inflata]
MSSRMTGEEQVQYLLSFYDEFQKWKANKEAELAKIPAHLLAMAQALDSTFRPFVNHIVKPKHPAGVDERDSFRVRATKVVEAGLNSFFFPADFLEVDYLSDSGSAAMTTEQWAQLIQGDESYGSNEGWPIFNDTIAQVFGPKFASVFLGKSSDAALNKKFHNVKNFNYIVNQGRGAESIFFAALADSLVRRDHATFTSDHVEYAICCSNNFFDTTSGHILNINNRSVLVGDKEYKITFKLMNFPNPKVKNGTYSIHDKYLGDGMFEALEQLVVEKKTRIGCVFTTITNNSGGSQPVSLAHIKQVSDLCKKNNLVYIMDACRFAENAFMIKKIENSEKSVQEIVHEIFSLVDGFNISLKKDGIANCGGAICLSPMSERIMQFVDQPGGCMLQQLMDTVILQIGHFTYGALTGRDIKAICVGLKHVVKLEYLEGRVKQVHRFAKILTDLGVPVLTPCGTSAVYLDVDKFFADKDKSLRKNYFGNSLVGISLAAGIRMCELGSSAFSSPHGNAPYATPEEVSGNFVRLAIPRQLYSDNDLFASALWLAFLFENKAMIKPVIDRPNLRQLSLHHFKMMFDFAK